MFEIYPGIGVEGADEGAKVRVGVQVMVRIRVNIRLRIDTYNDFRGMVKTCTLPLLVLALLILLVLILFLVNGSEPRVVLGSKHQIKVGQERLPRKL